MIARRIAQALRAAQEEPAPEYGWRKPGAGQSPRDKATKFSERFKAIGGRSEPSFFDNFCAAWGHYRELTFNYQVNLAGRETLSIQYMLSAERGGIYGTVKCKPERFYDLVQADLDQLSSLVVDFRQRYATALQQAKTIPAAAKQAFQEALG